MKINYINQNYKTYNYNLKNTKKDNSFGASHHKYATGLLTYNKTLLLLGVMMLGGLFACNNANTNRKSNTTTQSYNITNDKKEELQSTYTNFKSKLAPNNFLDGVALVITDKAKNIKEKSPYLDFIKNDAAFSETYGVGLYSDKKLQRYIVIQTKPENKSVEADISYLNCVLMHEVGHQFDEFYGHSHDAKFAIDFDNLLHKMITNPYSFKLNSEEEIGLFYKYQYNNSLSDKKEFKEAIFSDYLGIQMTMRTQPEKIPDNIDYYTQGINLSTDINTMPPYEVIAENVDDANIARREVYATLFSYALKNDDGKRETFIKLFPNAYTIVKKDIQTYLGNDFACNE